MRCDGMRSFISQSFAKPDFWQNKATCSLFCEKVFHWIRAARFCSAMYCMSNNLEMLCVLARTLLHSPLQIYLWKEFAVVFKGPAGSLSHRSTFSLINPSEFRSMWKAVWSCAVETFIFIFILVVVVVVVNELLSATLKWRASHGKKRTAS